MAVQRAMTVKVILDNNSEREKDYRDYNKRGFEGKNNNFRGRKYDSEKEEKVGNKSKENNVNKNFRGGFAKKEGGQVRFSLQLFLPRERGGRRAHLVDSCGRSWPRDWKRAVGHCAFFVSPIRSRVVCQPKCSVSAYTG